ncbi:MAG: mycothiol synthase [Jatrophihabitans sp.]|uniref:mycothiol synthase n=1 Tax=Jatrophihabitans sp. TaxID=1932789 RepID=UPI003F7D8335
MVTVAERRPDAAAVRRLAADLESRFGAPPLSDQTLGLLASDDVVHLVAEDDGALVGYAQRAGEDLEIAADAASAEALLDAALAASGPVRTWTHGRNSPLPGVLETHGFTRTRVLHQLLLPTLGDVPATALPDGVTLRSFVVGQDEDAWLAVNAAAFAHHPEQGRWTRADLAAREAEEWFAADDLLLAERDDALVGFHWTKVHPDGRGEVYVLGVAPAAQGTGLGGALLRAGLRHLRDRGCPDVLLYVDDDNQGALRLYERAGFQRYDVDVQWTRETDKSGEPSRS